MGERAVGARVSVWWPLDEAWYAGVVVDFDRQRHRHTVAYDDGDVENPALWAPNELVRALSLHARSSTRACRMHKTAVALCVTGALRLSSARSRRRHRGCRCPQGALCIRADQPGCFPMRGHPAAARAFSRPGSAGGLFAALSWQRNCGDQLLRLHAQVRVDSEPDAWPAEAQRLGLLDAQQAAAYIAKVPLLVAWRASAWRASLSAVSWQSTHACPNKAVPRWLANPAAAHAACGRCRRGGRSPRCSRCPRSR